MMKKWGTLGGILTVGAVLALGSTGCATKGYMRDQIAELRQDMEAGDTELSTRIDECLAERG
ncbi:MAG: hypothetical protein R3E12_05395 [Candidatus Eisenbacteria bacterium]